MKIGVISDTHLLKPSDGLKALMVGAFADVSLILHAGDITRMAVLEALSEKEVIAVCGNMDEYDVSQTLPAQRVVNAQGYRIGLIHGWGDARGVENRIIDTFDDHVHAIVYGHTHQPANHIIGETLMFNPGAFSGGSTLSRNPSVGILTIDKDGINGTILYV